MTQLRRALCANCHYPIVRLLSSAWWVHRETRQHACVVQQAIDWKPVAIPKGEL
jgi:hypothetical protein